MSASMPARTLPMFLPLLTASTTGWLWMICITSKPFIRPKTSAVHPNENRASNRTAHTLFLTARPPDQREAALPANRLRRAS